ncbi:MAG: ATP synthase F0 subunit B [Myxococcales bacterium]|nr:ATP synthase F0 subunit B [Myxococcales bacterium]
MRSFVRSLALAAALVGAPAVALAQPADQAEVPAGEAHAGAEHGEAHGGHADPSKHFNFFGISYRNKDVAGGKMGDGKLGDAPLAEGHEEEPMSAPFVLMLLNFGILLVILAKLGGPPARKMAETRSDEIKGALDEAAKLRKQAAAKLDEYNGKLAASEAEMDALLKGMRADAEADKARILANAETQAAAVKRDAELRIAAEIERARAELAREVAVAAAGAAEKLLREKTNATDHASLVDGFIRDVEAAARGSKGAI